MGARDHQEIVLNGSRGLYDRQVGEINYPEGYLAEAVNLEFVGSNLKSRAPFTSYISTTPDVHRAFRFARSTGAVRYLWLDGSGNLYDTGAAAPGTPIIAAATAGWGTPTDFSMVSMFDRAYITPHNRTTGLSGSNLWVYNPDWTGVTVRQAGLTRPGAWGGGSATAAGGNCEPGIHLVAVAFETTSGFISRMSSTVLQFTCTAANRTINLLNIPTGTANVVTRRHVLMTKVIPNFNGDVFSSEWFRAAIIADNTTTTLNISMYDTELVKSMDYLEDVLETIPAGVCITDYKGSLCVGGENANPGIIRVSIPGDPETMAATDGFINAASADGRGVRNMVERSGSLFIFKSARTLVSRDNSLSPNTWPVENIDGALGCECFGVGRLFESGDLSQDAFFVANQSGLHLFAGSFSPITLSHNIARLWREWYEDSTRPVQVAVDPFNKVIYCNFNLGILAGNYEEGLDASSIRWTKMRASSGAGAARFLCILAAPPNIADRGLVVSPAAIVASKGLYIMGGTGGTDSGWNEPIYWELTSAVFPRPSMGYMSHVSEVRVNSAISRSGGLGQVGVKVDISVDSGNPTDTEQVFEANVVGQKHRVHLCNVIAGSFAITYRGPTDLSSTNNAVLEVFNEFVVFMKNLWASVAQ